MIQMNKLNAEALEQVTGGKLKKVGNSTVNYANVRTPLSPFSYPLFDMLEEKLLLYV